MHKFDEFPTQDRTFADQIIRTMTGRGKGSEMAMVCALDICRAASRVRPNPEVEVPLISVANDVAHEVKVSSLVLNTSSCCFNFLYAGQFVLLGSGLSAVLGDAGRH